MANKPNTNGWTDIETPSTSGWSDVDTPKPAAKSPAPKRSWMQQAADAYEAASLDGFGGLAARKFYDWTDYGKADLKKRFPKATDAQIEAMADKAIANAQKERTAELATRREKDGITSAIVGGALGSAGPESLINPAKGVVKNIVTQIGLGGATDLAYQGAEIADEVRDEVDWRRAGESAALAGVLSGGVHAAGAGIRKVRKIVKGKPVDVEVPAEVEGGAPLSRGPNTDTKGWSDVQTPEQLGLPMEEQHSLPLGRDETGSGTFNADYLNSEYAARPNPLQGEADQFLANRPAETDLDFRQRELPLEQPPQQMSLPLDEHTRSTLDLSEVEALPPRPGAAPEAVAPEIVNSQTRLDDVTAKIDEIKGSWKNAPEVETVNSIHDIADPKIRAQAIKDKADGALGFFGPDGKVRIIAENISDPSDIPSVLFHEGLGHHGLAQKFGDDLDTILGNFYEKGPGFKERVDTWMKENPSAYRKDPNRLARAAEEILAQDSEKGRINPSLLDKLTNTIKNYARKMGIDLKVSEREIRTILGMAHDAVINGKKRDVRANGFRYDKPKDVSQEYYDSLTDAQKTELDAYDPDAPQTFSRNPGVKEAKAKAAAALAESRERDFQIEQKMNALDSAEGTVEQLRRLRDDAEGPEVIVRSEDGLKKMLMEREGLLESPLPENVDTSFGDRRAKQLSTERLYDDVPEQHHAWVEDNIVGPLERGDITLGEARNLVDAVRDAANRIGPKAHNDNLIKYMMRKEERELEQAGVRAKSSDLTDRIIANIDNVKDLDEALAELGEAGKKEITTWDQAKKLAPELNVSKVLKGKSIGEVGAKVYQMEKVQSKVLHNVSKLVDRLDERFTPEDQAELLRQVSTLSAVHAKVTNDVAQLGRALNMLKILKNDRLTIQTMMQEFQKRGGSAAALSDPAELLKFARALKASLDAGNDQAAGKQAIEVLKPFWEDYLLTGRHAAMLSGVGTHYKNIVENAAFIVRDLEEGAVAMAGGKVTPAEMTARVYGLIRAFADSGTYWDTLSAFRKGHPNKEWSAKVEIENARIPGVSYFLDALNAEDTFFRAFLDSMNLHALGVREAQKQGLKGLKAFEQGNQLAWELMNERRTPTLDEMIKKHTRDMLTVDEGSPEYIAAAKRLEIAQNKKKVLDNAVDRADRALLVDQPGSIVSGLERYKARKPIMTPRERSTRFIAHVLFPFLRVSDRLIARRLKRSPLALVSREFKQARDSGDKAEVHKQVTAMLMGTAALTWYAHKALEGELEGADPGYKKMQSLEAGGYQPNSVVTDDRYVDATAVTTSFNPFDFQNAVATDVATIVKSFYKGEMDERTATERMKAALGGLVSILTTGSFAENLQPPLDAMNGISNTEENEGKGDAAIGSFFGGLAASFVPTAVRTANTSQIDTTKRITTGDKSITGRVAGRVQASLPSTELFKGVPVLEGSKELPVNYDVYGRPKHQGKNLSGVNNYQMIDQAPAVKELQRLERTQKEPLVTPVSGNITVNGEPKKLVGKEFAEFQRVAGTLFLQRISPSLNQPGWNRVPDALKKMVVKEVLAEAKKDAKEYLYPEEEEDEE